MTRTGPWTLVLLFVFASTAVMVDTAQAQLEQTGSVEGMTCIDGSDGCWNAIPNATITLERTDGVVPASYKTTSNSDGWFGFKEVPAGTYKASASHTGFSVASSSVLVKAENASRIELRLEPQSVTPSVTVANESGSGIDATVRWWSDRTSGSSKISAGKGSLSTTSGYHSFEISAPGYAQTNKWFLVDGTAISFTLAKVPPQTATITGVIKDQDGTPVSGAIVEVYQYGGYDYDYDYEYEEAPPESSSSSPSPIREPYYPQYGGNNQTRTAADGSYRIHVWAGEVNLNIHKAGHAQRHDNVAVKDGQTLNLDVKLLKFPEKTAHIEGRIIGSDGKALRYVSLNLWSPAYGIRECSIQAEDAQSKQSGTGNSSSSGGSGSTGSSTEPAIAYPEPYPYYDPGCVITMYADGTFNGDVTPGYTILEAWHDHWRTCNETSSSDGSLSRTCGPEYLGYSRTLDLQADQTTKIVVQLVARPAPDARVSGYVVDKDTKTAIPGVQVQFSNEENYGWGNAGTDKDGSYNVKLRNGYHRVHVWAEGYLPWQGTLFVPAKGNIDLDIVLTPGQETYGYCCYAYDDMAYAESSDGSVKASSSPRPATAPPMESSAETSESRNTNSGGSDGETVQDLGGGLGPYDAKKRAALQESSDNGAPGAGIALLAMALLGALLIARRQQ